MPSNRRRRSATSTSRPAQRLAGLGQVQGLGAAVMRVFAPFHQAGGDQLVQHAHQGRAFHAQRLGQRALAHTIAQAAGEDDGPGGGLGRP